MKTTVLFQLRQLTVAADCETDCSFWGVKKREMSKGQAGVKEKPPVYQTPHDVIPGWRENPSEELFLTLRVSVNDPCATCL